MPERPLPAVLALAAAVTASAAVPSADVTPAVRSSAALGIDLYRQQAAGDGNLFLSPYSIATALAMTWGGARGDTAAQMERALHLSGGPEVVHGAFGALQARLGATRDGRYELAVANRLFAQRGYTFRPEFFALLRDRYAAPLEEQDFRADPEPPRLHINRWVEGVTHDRIKELLARGKVRAETRLVLVNAVYFKAAWETPFPEYVTKPARFTSGGASFETPTMRNVMRAGYAARDGIQVLDMPYEGGEVSMTILLPGAVDGLADLERRLTPEALAGWTADLPAMRVAVELPRWSFTWDADLVPPLRSLGVEDAFDCRPPSRADFSGMTGKRDLCIDVVVHKAFVAVDEKGTEAAAATAVGMAEITSARPGAPPVFRADHPFLFLIRHRTTGALLFLGRVDDPR